MIYEIYTTYITRTKDSIGVCLEIPVYGTNYGNGYFIKESILCKYLKKAHLTNSMFFIYVVRTKLPNSTKVSPHLFIVDVKER